MILRNSYRLLHVLQCIRLQVLAGNTGSLRQPRNHVDGVETDGAREDAFQVVCDEGVVGHLHQEAHRHEGVVLDQQVQVLTADVETQHCVGLDLQAAVDLGRLVLAQVVVQALVDQLPAFLQLLLDLGCVVPVDVGHDARREPVELRGREGEEGGDGTHESHVEPVVGDLLGADGGAGDFGFWREVLLIPLIEVGNDRVDLTALILGDLNVGRGYLGEGSDELVTKLLDFRTFLHHFDEDLFLVEEGFDLELAVLDL